MKSKIPYPKATRSDEKRVPSSSIINDPILVQDALVLLGAPHIEREEFSRVYHGPLADTLVFVSEHMKGRKEVALARYRIHQLREAHLKSHLKQPDDITRPTTEKAASILSGAKRNVEILKKQLDDRQVALEESQDALERLRRKLDEKRRTTLLLSVLEQKEKIRVKRFQEMTKMIADLRKGVSETKSQPHSTTSSSTSMIQPPMAGFRLPRVSHTKNALMNLHAYHLRLTHLIGPRDTSESRLLGRLRTGIARQTGKSETGPNTGKFLDQSISFVRARAQRKRQFQPQSLPPVSELELERRHKANQAKERELQTLSDHTVALGFLCEHSISSVNIFVEKTSPVLRSSLKEEAPLAKGYIDVLRCIVVDAPGKKIDEARFVQQVRRTCNMRGRTVPSKIVAWVEDAIHKAHRQALFLGASAIPLPPSLTEEQEALIASYETSTRNVQDRTVKLLTRKVEKAEMGYSLVKDIQNLLQETKAIVG